VRSYRRDPQQRHPEWSEFTCSGDPTHVLIGSEYYALNPDGLPMATSSRFKFDKAGQKRAVDTYVERA
jgi:hypothetical protein